MAPSRPSIDDEPPQEWLEHATENARIVDPHLRKSLGNALERDRWQWRQRVLYIAGLEQMRREIEERDRGLFGELAKVLRQVQDSNALLVGTSVRVARLDNEREVTRQEVRDVHRWAEALKRDADASQNRAIVTAQQAVEATVKEARAEARLEVERDARKSLTTEITVKRTERRARSWSVRSALIGAAIMASLGGLGTLGTWLFHLLTGGK